MPLSISNSSAALRAPAGNWGVTWLATLLLASGTIFTIEVAMRKAGHRPSVIDNKHLWALQRDKVVGPSVVLLGSSRMQCGFATDEFRTRCPNRELIQLAVAGRKAMPTFRDLANDEHFRGVVIFSFRSEDLYRMDGTQQEFVDYYHYEYTLNDRVNREISTLLQSQLITRHPQIGLRSTIKSVLAERTLPRPLIMTTRADRSQYVDYSLAQDLDQRVAYQTYLSRREFERGRDPIEVWRNNAKELELLIASIHERGGHVVLIRYPTTQEAWKYEELRYPKADYWDWLATHTQATMIHYRDLPRLATVKCPDTSHIDVKDVFWVTNLLLNELSERDIL